MPAPTTPAPSRQPWGVSVVWFTALLAVHLYFVTIGWTRERLAGQEFRQAQTALSAQFIQREHNFSPAYPTPVLGAPWSIPMEFPLYQWTAVVLSNTTGLPLVQAGRTVTLGCFYLTLAALYLLLGRLGLPPPRRLLALGLVLACPLYLLYARAFLIESMALMLSLWFLAAFLETMATRRTGWLVAANLLGVAAATVKVTTFMVYLLPAALWGGGLLWQARPRAGQSWREFWDTAAHGVVGCALAPLLAAAGWVQFSDQVKALNPGAGFLNSVAMIHFNFGTWAQRGSAEFWRTVAGHWRDALQPSAFTVGTVLLGLVGPGRWRGAIAGLLGLFLASQLMFSNLYFEHQYYFYANGILLILAAGVAVGALLDHAPRGRWLRAAPWLLAAAMAGIQLQAYHRDFLPLQQLTVAGGEHTQLLRTLTDPEDVIVVVGDDWSSIIPYYTGRRALMITNAQEGDQAYLARAFAALRGRRVGALILSRRSQARHAILDRAERTLGILPGPAFTFSDDLVFYFHEGLYERVEAYLRANAAGTYNQLKLAPPGSLTVRRHELKEVVVASLADQSPFAAMTPAPRFNRNLWGVTFSTPVDHVNRFNAHAPSELVFQLPAGPHRVEAQYGMMEGAYLRKEPPNSDGVNFALLVRRPQHADRQLFAHFLDPQSNPADRGLHSLAFNFTLPEGAELIFQAGPGRKDDNAFDWAFWGRINLQ